MSSERRCRLEFSYREQRKKLVLFEDSFVIGRSATLKASFDCHSLSREHLKVELLRKDEVWITDLGTKFGTFVNCRQIDPHRAVRLNVGDQLHLGPLDDGADIVLYVTHGEKVASEREKVEMFDPVAMEIDLRVKELEELRAQVAEIENDVIEYQAEKKHAEELIRSIAEKEAELRHIQKELSVTSKKLAEVKADRIEYEEKLGPLRAEYEEITTKREFVTTELQKEKELVLALKEDIFELTAKKERLQEMLAESNVIEKKLNEMQSRIEEAAEIELEVEKNRSLISGMEERISLLTMNETQAQKRVNHLKEEVEALEEAKELLQVVSEKTREKEEKLKSVRTRLAEAEAQESKLQNSVHDFEARILKKKDEVSALESLKQRLTEETREKNAKLDELKERVKGYSSEKKKLEDIEAQITKRETELERLESDMEETRQHAIRTRDELDELQEELKANQAQFDHLKGVIEASTRTHNQLHETEATLQAKVAQLRERIEQYESLTVQIPGLEKREKELHSKVSALEEKELDLIAKIEQASEASKTVRESITTLKNEEKDLSTQIEALQASLEVTRSESEVMKRRYVLEAEAQSAEVKLLKAHTEREVEELLAKKLAYETEIAGLTAKLPSVQSTVSGLSNESQAFQKRIEEQKRELSKLNTAIEDAIAQKTKYTQDYEKALRGGHDELQAMKQRESEAFALWKTQEEKKARDRLTSDLQALSHQIASRVMASMGGSGSISRNALMESLEGKIRGAISSDGVEVATYNPELQKSARNFWSRSAAGVAALIAIAIGYQYIPQLREKVIAWNESRAKSSGSDAFVDQIRKAREEMTNLKLDVKTDFQDSYVDNILYNPGYLEMKQSEEHQKDWSIRLFQFFVAEKQDDRIVVDYITIEAALIRELTEERKVMSKISFALHLEKMKQIQKEKMDEMIKLVGGKKTWEKVRAEENSFYQERVVAILKGKVDANRKIASPDEPKAESAPSEKTIE